LTSLLLQFDMNILVFSTIMPAPLAHKSMENDVLFVTAKYHKQYNPKVNYPFVYVLPYSNFFTALFSRNWKEYRGLRKKGGFVFDNRNLQIISVPTVKKDEVFRKFFVKLSFFLQRKKLESIIRNKRIDIIHAH